MKIPLPLLLVALGASFSAGIGVMWWRRGAIVESGGWDRGPRLALPLTVVGGTTASDAAQVKADARAVVTSPQAYLASLRGLSPLKARSRIAAAIADMSLADARDLGRKAEVFGYGGDPVQWALVSSVFERWAELDAEGLLKSAREGEFGSAGNYYNGISAAFRELTLRDPEAAWKRALDLGTATGYAKRTVMATLGQTDPARALALVQAGGASGRDSHMASFFMQGWLGRDPQAALKAFGALPTGEFRSQLVYTMASAFAASDPAAALAWSKELKNPAERQQAMRQVLERMASDDPQRVLTMAEEPEYASLRRNAKAAAVGWWARKDFDAAFAYTMASKRPADQQLMLQALNESATSAQRSKLLEVAETLPLSVAKAIYQSAIGYRGMQNDTRPLDIIDKIASPSVREETLKVTLNDPWSLSSGELRELFSKLQPTSQTTDQVASLAHQMGWTDPEGAIKWAESLGSADLRKSALTAALSTWANADPTAAAQKAATLTDPAQREEALRTVANSWGPRDDKAALAWAETLSGKDRSAALGALVQNALRASPEQAEQLYDRFSASLDAESVTASKSKEVARSLAATLTENDPQQAIAWAQGLASPAAQSEAWAGIAEKWAGYDAQATSAWITTLPPSEGRDLAADRLVSAIARDDPQSAWAWSLSIADRGKRREAASRTLEAWKAYGEGPPQRSGQVCVSEWPFYVVPPLVDVRNSWRLFSRRRGKRSRGSLSIQDEIRRTQTLQTIWARAVLSK